jgi:hypothetical protein
MDLPRLAGTVVRDPPAVPQLVALLQPAQPFNFSTKLRKEKLPTSLRRRAALKTGHNFLVKFVFAY